MADPLLTRKRVLAAKIESTQGTYEALTASEAAFRVQDRQFRIVSETLERQKPGDLGNDIGVPAAKHTELTFTSHLCGSGASGSVPEWAQTFLPACAMSLSSTTFSQTSATSDWKTISTGHYQNGRLFKARGMMGNLVIAGTAGMPVELNWSFQGGWEADPADATLLSGMSITEGIPPIFAGSGSMTLNSSTAFKISQFQIDLGNQTILREDQNAKGGYVSGYIGNILPTVTMDPEATLLATQNWWAAQSAGTEVDLVLVIGTASNNTITITCPDLQLANAPEEGDRNGLVVDNLNFRVNGRISIAFS